MSARSDIRILHVIQRLSLGGAGRALCAQAKYSKRLGGTAHALVSLRAPDPAAVPLAQNCGLTVLDAAGRAALDHALEDADIVHVHFWNNPDIYSFLQASLPAMRLLITFHIAGDCAPHVVTRPLIDYADFVIASSPYTCDLPVWQNLPPLTQRNKTSMVYDSADYARLGDVQSNPHDSFNIGYIGTVDFVKMHPRYVPMSAAVEVPNARFVVCGSGGAWAALRRQAAQCNALERFDLRGYVEDIGMVLQTLDVFGYPLCPDNYSTGELVLQEAMYAGVPPVVLPYGGAARLVIHNQTGLIARNESEYAQAMEYLYHNPQQRTRLGERASAYARNVLGAENAAHQINRIYARLLEQPKRARAWCSSSAERTGAESFVESVGDAAPQFAISLAAPDVHTRLEAERRIAQSSPGLCNPGAGGILDYRRAYPDDSTLRVWSGLVLEAQGRCALAVAEYTAAIRLGETHWRVSWYLARAAAKIGAGNVAHDALTNVIQAAPEFVQARELFDDLERR